MFISLSLEVQRLVHWNWNRNCLSTIIRGAAIFLSRPAVNFGVSVAWVLECLPKTHMLQVRSPAFGHGGGLNRWSLLSLWVSGACGVVLQRELWEFRCFFLFLFASQLPFTSSSMASWCCLLLHHMTADHGLNQEKSFLSCFLGFCFLR